MIPIIVGLARAYAPYVVFPFALVIGTIGYNIEWKLRDKNNPNGGQKISVEKERDERLLQQLEETQDLTKVESLKTKSFVAKSIFEKNLSPSLRPHES
ncbi:hypothetical protein BLOT_003282 [Blomia tropicalis]|nr:hypothetical protein BLOT_003282 [Blomia tropicalis]